PVMDADYASGWGEGALAARPPMPAMLGPHPVTGAPVAAAGFALAAQQPLTGAVGQGSRPLTSDLSEVRRRLLRSEAWDGTENVSSAYGHCLVDFQWPCMSGIFAREGNK